ncbi:MAG: hypothetical protein RQ758_04000 [Methanomicrobiaceae archaeon]|nr:hypothetical protein [Methanomicrobiaceae archaeon]
MRLVRLRDDFYLNANMIRDISINEGARIPREAEPEMFQYFLIIGFHEPVFDEEEKVIWIGSAHQEDLAEKLLTMIVGELTKGDIPVVDLRPERFGKELLESL